MARIESLPDDLRTMFHLSIVRGAPKAAVCRESQIDGAVFDQTYSRLMRELKRDPHARLVLPQVPRLRFPFPPTKP
ncbi:hypothetical protein LJR290_007991 [Variovorax sp. LjRoot290]|uniref:hypothetical protein n=1 Tax=unclassified Variovorax TaxID=663243 RepID=UPI003ED05002